MPLNENILKAQDKVREAVTLLSKLQDIRRSHEDGDELGELAAMTPMREPLKADSLEISCQHRDVLEQNFKTLDAKLREWEAIVTEELPSENERTIVASEAKGTPNSLGRRRPEAANDAAGAGAGESESESPIVTVYKNWPASNGKKGFGFTLQGSTAKNNRGVYIVDSGHDNVQAGSRIVSINGNDFSKANRREVAEYIQTQKKLELKLEFSEAAANAVLKAYAEFVARVAEQTALEESDEEDHSAGVLSYWS